MKLVADWKNCWRWYSSHPKALGAVLTAAVGALAVSGAAAAWLDAFSLGVVLLIAAGLFVLSFVGRLLKQGALHLPAQPNHEDKP